MKSFYNYKFDENDPAERHEFEIHNVDVSIVNALRRILLSDVPHIGFMGEGDECSVTVSRNTGALHNEFLQHRIGMIPIHFNDSDIDTFADHEYKFTLDVKNTSHSMRNVTSHDFDGYKDDVLMTKDEIKRLFPVHPVSKDPVLITRLRMNEEINLEAEPVISTAKHHAAFSPVSMCCFYNKENTDEASKVTGILEKERCFHRNEFNDPTLFVFQLERECDVSVLQLVSTAFDILLKKVHDGMHKIDTEELNVKLSTSAGFDFEFLQEDDTLGNVIQSHIHSRYVRLVKARKERWNDAYDVSYAGYYCPHPLDTRMVVRIVLKKNDEIANDSKIYRDFMMDAMNQIHVELMALQQKWVEFAPKS